MAVVVVEEQDAVKKTNRESLCGQKLLPFEKVEVRSLEDGFQGSWHMGTVIACCNQGRRIKYDHLLVDDGSDDLVEDVGVSTVVDGNGYPSANQCYRGCIRPLPPPMEFNEWTLHYGLCVDVYHMDAWWEGVIFDHKDGSEERKVFFPDLGDEMMAGIDALRVTQDWDEFTEDWHHRGAWLFLELIEELQQANYVAVSAKQIWYEIREKKGFQNVGEWTSTRKRSWKELILQVIEDNTKFVVDNFFLEEPKLYTEWVKPAGDDNVHSERDLTESHSVVPAENAIDNGRMCLNLAIDQSAQGQYVMSQLMCISKDGVNALAETNGSCHDRAVNLLPAGDATSCITSITSSEGFSRTQSDRRTTGNPKNSELTKTEQWMPAGPDIAPEAESCPSAITEYLHGHTHKRDHLTRDVRKHLKHMGWSIDMKKEGKHIRLRYKSPDGKQHFSLLQVCKHLVKSTGEDNYINIKDNQQRGNQDPNHFNLAVPSFNADVLPELEGIPQAVLDYCKIGSNETSEGSSRNKAVIQKVKRHLSDLGWEVCCRHSNGRPYFCYTSPKGRKYFSLVQACEACIKEGGFSQINIPDCSIKNASKEAEGHSASSYSDIKVFQRKFCPQAVLDWCKMELEANKGCFKNPGLSKKVKEHLSYLGWTFRYARKKRTRYLYYISPEGKIFMSLLQACKFCMEEGTVFETQPSALLEEINVNEEADIQFPSHKSLPDLSNMETERSLVPVNELSENWSVESPCSSRPRELVEPDEEGQGTGNLGRKRKYNLSKSSSHVHERYPNSPCKSSLEGGKKPATLIKLRRNLKNNQRTYVSRSRKRALQVEYSSSVHRNPRTVLSWLIDNNVVLPRAKVYYNRRKTQRPIAEGRITCEGIKCICCSKVYTLSKFEAHAGSTCRRPAANIFLEDGRSLLDCQLQLLRNNKICNSGAMLSDELKGNCNQSENDSICSVCHYGGELILCDRCPSSFHKHCLGLVNVPDGDWFCPSCCCGICGQSKFQEAGGISVDDRVLNCDQCHHKYHFQCLRKRGVDNLETCFKDNWFCSKSCEKVFLDLHELLGKPIPLGVDNLTWTLVKPIQSDTNDPNGRDTEASIENHSKLNVALAVMHECFEPVKEPSTGRDIVEDVIFNRRSELKRLNFQGFYTVLLEKNEELITVATVRVYGDKVAELPLVGTRFQYRQLGMCRMLLNELEKKLMELGVERLMLPAVPSVLATWTNSFGFSRVSDSERLKLLDYSFLDFEDTVMCQKLLSKRLSSESSPSRGTQHRLHNGVGSCNDVNVNVLRVSQGFQTGQIEQSRVVDQGKLLLEHDGGDKGTHSEYEASTSEVIPEHLLQDANVNKNESNGRGNADIKCYKRCYKRRRISAS